MYSDNPLILNLLSLLKQFGIRRIVISPGSRHFSIIHSMENDPFFDLYSVVDERSAAFFALGLIQRYNEPAAVCCTSGTSAINYGSAVVEAFYQRLPLLLLTADRLPEFLGQMEDQMFKQDDAFHHFIKYHGQLKQISNSFDEWFCNRVINEGLLALNHHGQGPVQLNIPIENHHLDTFAQTNLPAVRKITRYFSYERTEVWNGIANSLRGKKVMIIWGQTHHTAPELREVFNTAVKQLGAVVLTDNLSNWNGDNTLDDTFLLLRALKRSEKSEFSPDIVISMFGNYVFNGEIKGLLRPLGKSFEHWLIDPSGIICDPFKRLTRIFEMREDVFFSQILTAGIESKSDYYEKWKLISDILEEPKVPYSELYAIGDFIKSLPKNVDLHIANSSPIRMFSTFKLDPTIKVYCNRGVNGIDGCMSTTVGFSANTDNPVFLVIGDLTFFYDMNALWNRHLGSNIRILLLNNEGGAVMHMPLHDRMASILPKHVSAGHGTSAKGWVESLGIRYISATNERECQDGVQILTDNSYTGAVVLEVFTQKESDVKILKEYFKSLNRETLMDKVKMKASSKIKGVLKHFNI
ncbi:2-succinyl-5-enolpyruvyl-6-hydroxy-3-cyclohexene-1-carboxylic-acid synthase [Sphingobacterium olei]|uniref:2-succinyl-5-enolpyruvyl-6-hydroxy-3-cyclohexene-1-carboxylic-acid synthase n=1 Tax=Sphingobacterium olei TaxID=2571155 RepID=A0A4V5MM69_9SPHI|nr:2-succinyl-5-enolpyruvyl-6-hydroxy-3-cyclohexene-1-carboxylic-acid synthase [Sphingobacterium olei]TJZ59878.1 2-succinyl-5-enolpyruvyl-6-hydroxy-3-cyclohexene-1-carboxylic-acid synthase [Sphingobacterium olei]